MTLTHSHSALTTLKDIKGFKKSFMQVIYAEIDLCTRHFMER